METTKFNKNANMVDKAALEPTNSIYSNTNEEKTTNIKDKYKTQTQPNTIDLSVLDTPTTKITNTPSNTSSLIQSSMQGISQYLNGQKVPDGWDAETYANYKKQNPDLEPTNEDTIRMQNAGNRTVKQTNFDIAQSEADKAAQSVSDAMKGSFGKGKALESAYSAIGANERQAKIDEIDELIANKYNSLKQQEIQDDLDVKKLKEQMAGTPVSVVRGRQALLEAQRQADRKTKAVEIEGLAAISNLYQGKLDKAKENIKNSIDMEYADREKAIENEKFFLSRSDDKRAEARKEMLDEETRKLDFEKAQKEKSYEYITNAVQSGAPSSLTKKAQEAVMSGADSVGVARILGNYSLSYSERLSNNLKQAEYNALVNKVGKEEAEKQQQLKAQVPALKEKISLIDSIIGKVQPKRDKNGNILYDENKKIIYEKTLGNIAIETTVGTTRMGRQGMLIGIPFIGGIGSSPDAMLNKLTGKQQQLIGSVNQLVSKEFLSAVLNLKSQGGTLGQLTEREGEKLQNAATKIGTWEIRNKKGEVTGYNIDEKSFVAELNKIRESTKAIYEASGGDTNNLLNLTEEEYAEAASNGGSAFDNFE